MPSHNATERRVGTTIGGKYHLERVLGAGGMGTVFEATNTWTQRRVAVKLMQTEDSADGEAVQRFFREARATAAIHHPHVIDVLDMGQDETEALFYLVMEFLEGSNLGRHLQRRGPLPAAEALRLLAPVMDALSAAHFAGVVHRDVKPDNIFLVKRANGELFPKLIDFGIARMERASSGVTRSNTVMGTPAYMAPEQARGDREIGPQADVWAMGAVLYQCLSNELPFDGENAHQLLAAILTSDPVPIGERIDTVSAPLAAIVHRALERDPRRRYSSMAGFLDALLQSDEVRELPWCVELRAAVAQHERPTALPGGPSSEELSNDKNLATMPASASSRPRVRAATPPVDVHTNAGITAPTPRGPGTSSSSLARGGVAFAVLALALGGTFYALRTRAPEGVAPRVTAAPAPPARTPPAPAPPALAAHVAEPPALAAQHVEPPPPSPGAVADASVSAPPESAVAPAALRPRGRHSNGPPASPAPPPALAASPPAPAPAPPASPPPAAPAAPSGEHTVFRNYE